ncbi:tetratricopeptide repeat protein, partial [bacterium]|nr:tetratricopeptide repeat protein [bacterium]
MAWPEFVFIFVMPGANELSALDRGLFVSLVEDRRWAEAVKFYEDLRQKDPDCLPVTNALAKVAYENRDFTAAFGLLGSLVKKNPGSPIWLNNLGVVAAGRGDLVVARGLLQQAEMVSGSKSEILYNLGCLAVNENNKESALKIFSQIIVVEPGHIRALFALSRIAKELGRVDEAITYCSKLVEQAPNEAEFRQNLGIVLLKKGDWEEGFELYEARWQANRLGQFASDFLWQGEDLSGKTILVWSEQGLGDTINFVRYLPQLNELAGSVVLVVQEVLVELLRSSFPKIKIMGLCERDRVVHDVQVPLLNLPRFFQAQPDVVAPVNPYLRVSEEFQKKWCLRLVTDRTRSNKVTCLQVGVVWAGNPHHANDINRSISLKLFSRIFALKGVSFYSLQKEQVAVDVQLI